jgi:hypothetical protein
LCDEQVIGLRVDLLRGIPKAPIIDGGFNKVIWHCWAVPLSLNERGSLKSFDFSQLVAAVIEDQFVTQPLRIF